MSTPTEEPQEPRARAPRRATSARPKRPGHGKVKPPTTVNPGWVHDLAAAMTLRYFEQRAGGNPGNLSDEFIARIPGAEDSPEPAVLLARVYAHIAWRIPFLRAWAKRFEGREARAGLGSDALALAVQLWVRNQDLINAAVAAARDSSATAAQADATVRARAAADPEPMREANWKAILTRRFGVNVPPDASTDAPITQAPHTNAAEGMRP